MPNVDPNRTVDSYIDGEGNVYLYEKNRWGGERMVESLPKTLLSVGDDGYKKDGQWWTVEQPLSTHSIKPINERPGNLNEDHYLVQTNGPGVESQGSYIPSEYRVVCKVPIDILQLQRIVMTGEKSFTDGKLVEFENRFWTKPRLETAWKYIKTWLPTDIPEWEVQEAKARLTGDGAQRPTWISSPTLAAMRRHYFENRRQYNSYILGREETEEERQQRLDFARDARVMAAFYRAFGSADGRSVLLRKTKKVGAKRLINQHDRQYKETYEKVAAQFAEMKNSVEHWYEQATRSN